jgi:hypothetical protein
MELKGIEGMTFADLHHEVERGGKFVHFTYCFSIVVMTFRRSSDIYFVRSGESAIKYGWPNILISALFGWWGIPWGPIYTIQAIVRAFSGKDVTDEVLQSLSEQASDEQSI